MTSETYILAPSVVVYKARKLADAGLYQQALDLLIRNQVIFDIWPTHAEVRLPSEQRQKAKREEFISRHRMAKTVRSKRA